MTENPDARLVDVQIEVPGTPEEVWHAIATGPGIACWFTTADVEEREGGSIVTHHGSFGDSEGTITAWEPPHRFAYEEREWAEGAPPWATEILVEARKGGTCVVRLISGIHSGGADWEDDIAGSETGWTLGLENLRLYLTHFAGQPVANEWVMTSSSEPLERAWPALTGALGITGAQEGDRVTLLGHDAVVERALADTTVLRGDAGIIEVIAHPGGDGATHLSVRAFLFGEGRGSLDTAAVEALMPG